MRTVQIMTGIRAHASNYAKEGDCKPGDGRGEAMWLSELRLALLGDNRFEPLRTSDMDCRREGREDLLRSSREMPNMSQSSFWASVIALNSDEGVIEDDIAKQPMVRGI